VTFRCALLGKALLDACNFHHERAKEKRYSHLHRFDNTTLLAPDFFLQLQT